MFPEHMVGAGSETRTRDLSFTKALLYQLSYPGKISIVKHAIRELASDLASPAEGVQTIGLFRPYRFITKPLLYLELGRRARLGKV